MIFPMLFIYFIYLIPNYKFEILFIPNYKFEKQIPWKFFPWIIILYWKSCALKIICCCEVRLIIWNGRPKYFWVTTFGQKSRLKKKFQSISNFFLIFSWDLCIYWGNYTALFLTPTRPWPWTRCWGSPKFNKMLKKYLEVSCNVPYNKML